MSHRKTLVSGVKPTGMVHIGNYFGAMKRFVDMQDDFESFVFIADLHALTSVQDRRELEENTMNLATDYLAIGLDPKKTTLYKQSDVPEVAELAWIFNCITTMPYLMRAHSFKDAEAKNKEINVGIFDYPMLMAADILLANADVVPVGKDQKQHIEFTRDTAEKFNRIFGETFKLPEALTVESTETVLGIDGQKMSKSYGNTIPLFAEDDEIEKLVMSIVTDSSGEYPENVFKIHQLFRTNAELDEIYEKNKGQYKKLKEMLAEDIKSFIRPIRERRRELEKDREYVIGVLEEGRERVRHTIEHKVKEVRKNVGLTLK